MGTVFPYTVGGGDGDGPGSASGSSVGAEGQI